MAILNNLEFFKSIKNKNFRTISTFHNVYSGNSFLKKIYNKQLSKVDQIVAISNYVKNEIIKKYNLDEKKIIQIKKTFFSKI